MTLEHPTLEQWLQRATRGLSKDSAAQVRREIQEHYQAAQDDAVAELAAVAALGDPGVANHEYKKVLLTKEEARLLRSSKCVAQAYGSRPWLKYSLLAVPVFLPLLVSVVYWLGFGTAARIVLALGMLVSLVFVTPFLPVYTPSRSRIFRAVKWVAIFGMLWVAAGFPPLASFTSGILSSFWLIAWIEWQRASIRRKLPVKQWPKALYL